MAVLRIEGDASGALRSISSIERSLAGLKNTARSVQTALGGIVAAVAGAGLASFVDDLQNMENKLRIATGSQQEFNQAMTLVKAIADKTGQSLAATGDLYAAVARNADKLGYSQAEVATVTNAMATALKASGTSAQGAASVMYQFSQILAKGKVNGDEFTTIMENLGGPVMDLVAKNMGLTTKQLLEYKEKGLIGAKDFTDALIRSMAELDGMAGKSAQTLQQSMTRIQNAFGTAFLAIDKATGFSEKFAAAAQKISDNSENLVPILKTIGLVLGGLAVYFAPVVTLFTAAAAAAIYFADVLGPILKPVIDTVEAALGGLIKRLVGFGAAVKAALSGENPFEAYNKSLEEWDKKATTATGKITAGQKALDDAAKSATTNVGRQAAQLTGVADKYQEILRDLNLQLEASKASADQANIENQLLTYKKQLVNSMTAAQESELRTLLQKIEANKQLAKLQKDLTDLQRQTALLSIQDNNERNIALALEDKRRQYGEAAYNAKKAEIELALRANAAAEAQRNIEQEILRLQDEQYGLTIQDVRQREIAIAIRAKERELGSALTADAKERLATELKLTQAARDREAIMKNIRDYSVPKTGAQAAIDASGQMGQLDPVKAAMTANQSLFNGLEELRRQGLIDEESYQRARVSAAVRANDDIMAANRRMFENQKMYELQSQKNSIFGYETQKQIAKDAADFQMKSDYEKAQWGIQQTASVFSELGKQNKKAFEASKALNIATALMNTYQGATKALATYPWPFGLIAAAAAVAAGLAQVSAIRSQQYSGRALGGPVMGGKPYIVGENGPELFTPATTGSITRNQDLGASQPVNVNFTIVANDTAGFDQLLTSRRGVIQQIISDAMLERGQRSII